MTGKQPHLDWVFFDQKAESLCLRGIQPPANILSTQLPTATVDNNLHSSEELKNEGVIQLVTG